MRAVLLLAALAAACAAQDWRPLFNGKNLDGWAVAGHGMLWYTRQKLGNGTLRVVYRMSNRKGNSGIFIRIPSGPGTEGIAVHRGIEVQIDDNDNDWHRTGVLRITTASRPFRRGSTTTSPSGARDRSAATSACSATPTAPRLFALPCG